jgi:hypothetical protein
MPEGYVRTADLNHARKPGPDEHHHVCVVCGAWLLSRRLSVPPHPLIELRLSEYVPDHINILEVSAWTVPQRF